MNLVTFSANTQIRVATALLAAAALMPAGCRGTSQPAQTVVPAKGKIVVEGKPLSGAKVFCVPNGGDAKDCGAATDENGEFQLVTAGTVGAVPGTYRVMVQYYVKPDGSPLTVSAAEADAGMDLDQFIAMGQVKPGIPKRYLSPETSQLTLEVPAAGTESLQLSLSAK